MPLIALAGFPCCGKTSFANKLAEYLERNGVTAIVVNEESLMINKRTAFQDAFHEKLTRGALKSAVDQKLNNKTVVILDSMNYIKGFRYELHCTARELRTSHCVVWVRCNDLLSENWNKGRPEEERYDASLFFELRQRFEVPNSNNRWDYPLFHVNMTPPVPEYNVLVPLAASAIDTLGTGDPVILPASAAPPAPPMNVDVPSEKEIVISAPEARKLNSFRRAPKKKDSAASADNTTSLMIEARLSSAGDNDVETDLFKHKKLTFSGTVREETPLDIPASSVIEGEIVDNSPDACFARLLEFVRTAVAPPPNPATVATPHLKANMLYLLDKTSQDVNTTIIYHQNNSANVTDPILFREYDRALELHRTVSLAELQRHRRQFVKVNSQIPPSNEIDIGASYIDFLALHL